MWSEYNILRTLRIRYPQMARVLPQALLAGKPVVSFDVDGAREVVLDGETGFLVPPRSVEGLREAMESLGFEIFDCGELSKDLIALAKAPLRIAAAPSAR